MYKLSTNIDPFMKTQTESDGYVTSYAQVRAHHGTHADFPAHVNLEGEPRWDLSGSARIQKPSEDIQEVPDVILFDTGGEEISEELVHKLCNSSVSVVGTDHTKIGSLEHHKKLLSNGVVIVENLINLNGPPSKTGHVYCFAFLIEGCPDGAPVTVGFEPY